MQESIACGGAWFRLADGRRRAYAAHVGGLAAGAALFWRMRTVALFECIEQLGEEGAAAAG